MNRNNRGGCVPEKKILNVARQSGNVATMWPLRSQVPVTDWRFKYPDRAPLMLYIYHYKDMDGDSRPPACYQLTYRGCKYWSCYCIHLRDWFSQVMSSKEKTIRG